MFYTIFMENLSSIHDQIWLMHEMKSLLIEDRDFRKKLLSPDDRVLVKSMLSKSIKNISSLVNAAQTNENQADER